MKISYLLLIVLVPFLCNGQVVKSYNKTKEGISITLPEGTLGIYPMTDNAIRVNLSNEPNEKLQELVFLKQSGNPAFNVTDSPSIVEVKCKNISVLVDKKTGSLSFIDQKGKTLLREIAG